MGAVTTIVDESGRDWSAGEPIVGLNKETVAVDETMPPAGYEIRWLVVSSDGHPIIDLVPFTVGDGQPFTAVPAEAAAPQEAAGAPSTQAGQNQALRTLSIGAIGATFDISLFALILFIRRRLSRSDDGVATSE
jgi:hypothetical protein